MSLIRINDALNVMDKFSVKKRSEIMSKVKGKNTRLETKIFDLLNDRKIRFEKHGDILGKPDILFRKKKVAVFIDGDFWHGWNFDSIKEKLPKYWYVKISQNMKRDRRNRNRLREQGWKIVRLWEHRVLKNPQGCINIILKYLDN